MAQINLNINDSETKTLLKETLTGEAAKACLDALSFRSMEMDAENGGPIRVRLTVSSCEAAGVLPELKTYMENATGKKAEFSFEFTDKAAGAPALAGFWPYFTEANESEKAWLEHTEPLINEAGKLVLSCKKDVVFNRLSDKKMALNLKKKMAEFSGAEVDFSVERHADASAQAVIEPSVRSFAVSKPKTAPSKVMKDEPIPGDATPIENIQQPGRYVIEGRIFTTEDNIRPFNGKMGEGRIVSFYVTDEKDTMKCIAFVAPDDGLVTELGNPKYCKYARVSIEASESKYETDLTGTARRIQLIDPPVTKDTAAEKRVELHAHTQMSAMDATTDVEAFIRQASAWGHPAVAVTDHGVVHAFPTAFLAVNDKKKPLPNPIKLILGIEGYLVESDEKVLEDDDRRAEKFKNEKRYHIIMLVKDRTGLRNLYKMVSGSHLDYFYKKPRIPRKMLLENRQGLLLGSACYLGEVYTAVINKQSDDEIKAIAAIYDYLEIQPVENNRFMIRAGVAGSEDEIREMNRRIVRIGEELGKPVVATGDVHFLKTEDRMYREVLMAGQGYDDSDDGVTDLSFHTTDWMLKEFDYLGAEKAREVVVTNPGLIASMIEANIAPVPNKLHPPSLDNAEEEIKNTSWEKSAELYGENLPEIVRERVDRELKAIIGNKYAVLYLIAKKMVEKSNSDGYIVGSRGSVGSSMVAFLTGISEVNPMQAHYRCPKCLWSRFEETDLVGVDLPEMDCPICGEKLIKDGFNIPFETFMGFKGDKVPDIDLNFSGEYQDKIHKYVEELFGSDKVFRAGTIVTVNEKAIRKDFMAKYEDKTKKKFREAEKLRLARGASGVKRSTGQHAGGVMLVPRDFEIYDFTPIQHPPKEKDIITTHFDYHYIHDALVKVDALGHDLPTSFKYLCEELKINVNDIPLDDRDTMKIFSGVSSLKLDPKNYNPPVGTIGIPEYGTMFTRGMLEMTKPKTFSELVYIAGLSHGTNVWRGNAEELIKKKTATLKEVISVRDDIMNYLISMGLPKDVSFKITESVRKGNGLTPEWEALMKQHKVPEWYVNSCRLIKYMFPKAHAVAYAIMSVRIAYLKVHKPLYFYADYFSRNREGFLYDFAFYDAKKALGKRKELEQAIRTKEGNTKKEEDQRDVLEAVYEMKERGFSFKNVDIYESDPVRFRVHNGEIMMPLTIVPELGLKVAEAIAQERRRKQFKSVEDMVKRTKVNKNVAAFLNDNGISTDMPDTDQTRIPGL